MHLDKRLSAAMWGRVLLLWLVLGLAALALGIFMVYMGGFVQDNVRDELRSQQITFPTEDALTDAERAIDGMVDHAGEQMETGEQAQVYSEYILLHMNESAEEAGYPGATYATLGGPQRELRGRVASGDTAAQEELDTVTQLRNTMQTGSNLRGNLLQAYGWDQVGTNVKTAGYLFFVLALIFLALFAYELTRGHLPANEA
jgi:hypothetical protein